MRGRLRLFAILGLVGFLMPFFSREARAAEPAVLGIVEGQDAVTGRQSLTLVGKGFAAVKAVSLQIDESTTIGPTELLFKSKSVIVMRMPPSPLKGDYIVRLFYGKALTQQDHPVTLGSANTWVPTGSDATFLGGRVGIGTATPQADLHVTGPDGVLFEGPYDAGQTIPAEGAGGRMMWYPKKAAFRAGFVSETQWDDVNVGYLSMALGFRTTAKGDVSTALGNETTASGESSTAIGYFTTASANYSTAMGSETIANALQSTAMGVRTTASGGSSTAMGHETTASGFASTAMGMSTTASGSLSIAMGELTSASEIGATAMGGSTSATGVYSTAMGTGTTASGYGSTAMGIGTTAQPYASVALGTFNVVAGTSNSPVATDPVLVVGNGFAPVAASNAFTLLRNGNLTIAGTLTQNSDARAKTDVVPLAGVLAKIASLHAVTYRFKKGTPAPEGRHIGLLAQEVREAFPELVAEDAEGKLSVAYGNFAAVLLEAVKEQQATIEAQRKDLESMAKRLEALEARLGTAAGR